MFNKIVEGDTFIHVKNKDVQVYPAPALLFCVSLPLHKYNDSVLSSDKQILIKYWIGKHAFQMYTLNFDSLKNLLQLSFHSFIWS